MNWKITFKHTVEEFYVATIVANSRKEAMKIFEEEPFEHLKDEDPYDIQGLKIEIEEIEEN